MRVTAHCQGVSQTVQLHPRVATCEDATPHVPLARSTQKAGARRLSDDLLRGKRWGPLDMFTSSGSTHDRGMMGVGSQRAIQHKVEGVTCCSF